ncbi:dihydrofolate reductase family protein [Nocardia alni]|uniref:dihydrofolate reductase family protein n=1 Tax=Nocardia alni TaxID=2815723 RepID=UPI001C21DA07|nr:dihydrofolate reductase family protein [Nocardia alni]
MASTLTVDIFLSVDGWAGGDGLPGYFGYLGPDLEQWITEAGSEPQIAIMGRRTYQALAGLSEQFRDEGWERMSRTDTIVFSTTLRETSWPKTHISSGDLATEVAKLKADSDLPLRTIGSLSIARQLADAGLVDRLRLMTFPLLAGNAGRDAAFAGMSSGDLELVDHRVLDGRILLIEYRPTGRDIPRA